MTFSCFPLRVVYPTAFPIDNTWQTIYIRKKSNSITENAPIYNILNFTLSILYTNFLYIKYLTVLLREIFSLWKICMLQTIMIFSYFTGIPSPIVTWWRESILVDETYSQTSQGYVRNELVLPKLHRNDLLMSYSCQAVNTNLTVPVSASVTIDINCEYYFLSIQKNVFLIVTGSNQNYP